MDEESDGIFVEMVKQMSMSKNFPTKKTFCAILKGAVSKIEISKDFHRLDIVICSKEYSFSVNCVNYSPRVIKPLNEYCSFNFYYNFFKKNNSRTKRSPLFTVKARCAMNKCPMKSAI